MSVSDITELVKQLVNDDDDNTRGAQRAYGLAGWVRQVVKGRR